MLDSVNIQITECKPEDQIKLNINKKINKNSDKINNKAKTGGNANQATKAEDGKSEDLKEAKAKKRQEPPGSAPRAGGRVPGG